MSNIFNYMVTSYPIELTVVAICIIFITGLLVYVLPKARLWKRLSESVEFCVRFLPMIVLRLIIAGGVILFGIIPVMMMMHACAPMLLDLMSEMGVIALSSEDMLSAKLIMSRWFYDRTILLMIICTVSIFVVLKKGCYATHFFVACHISSLLIILSIIELVFTTTVHMRQQFDMAMVRFLVLFLYTLFLVAIIIWYERRDTSDDSQIDELSRQQTPTHIWSKFSKILNALNMGKLNFRQEEFGGD